MLHVQNALYQLAAQTSERRIENRSTQSPTKKHYAIEKVPATTKKSTSPSMMHLSSLLSSPLTKQSNHQPCNSSVEIVQSYLDRVRASWEKYQASARKSAIFGYLSAVYVTAQVWRKQKVSEEYCRIALSLQLPNANRIGLELFSLIIYCTSDPTAVDAKTRSKWSRALRAASKLKKQGQKLEAFIRGNGGINACAKLFQKTRLS